MFKKHFAITFAFILAITVSVRAQLNPVNLKQIPETEGAEIFDVLADRSGNIWMATYNGLIRYDGYEIKRFHPDPNDSTTIAGMLTFSLFEDSSGKIWIGCMDNVSVYNPETKSFINYSFSSLTDFPDYSQQLAWTISEDNNGRIYLGIISNIGVTASHALVYFDKKESALKRFEYPDNLKVNNVFSSTIDPSGNVWILSDSSIFKIDIARNIHRINKPDNVPYLNAILSDKTGKIWMMSGFNQMFYQYNPENSDYKSWPMKNLFNGTDANLRADRMILDSSNQIWIGTNKGPVCFNIEKENFEIFKIGSNQQYKPDIVNGLCYDSFGDLWFGTAKSGLIRYSKKTILKSFVSDAGNKTSITPGWAHRIIENIDGTIWVFTSTGFNLLDTRNQTIVPYSFQSVLPGFEFTWFVAEQKPGEFLIETNRGHIVFNSKTKTYASAKLDPMLDSLHIFAVYNDSRDNVWYCTANGLFLTTKENSELQHFDLGKMPGSTNAANEVTGAFESKKYGLWVFTNGGLFIYDYKTGKLERLAYDKEKGNVLMSHDINSFYEDSAGLVWVGTWQGGLSRFNVQTGKIKTYKISDGLPSMSIQGILPDEKNNALWLSTFEGISRFSITDEQFSNFSLADGIQGLLYGDGACLKTSEGVLIFGGNNGITVFNPDDIARNSPPPKVFITGFKIGNSSMKIAKNNVVNDSLSNLNDIRLAFNQNNISIDYTGIHYANPAKNKFAYKLENYDTDWREVGSLRTANYYGLPPGKYIFRVKAANSNGVWNETGASIHITVTPPWWRTWWAYCMYALLFVALVFAFDRIQRRRIHEKERSIAREKELIQAKEIEKAYTDLKATQSQLIQSEKMASLGELTAGIAHEIQNPLNFVNNFSEVSKELIVEMNEELAIGNMQLAKEIAGDIEQNLEKINHHGKRAADIVKGMLQHSRISSGVKEPTDINALADEYLRLAYHGLRAKDKSFNADFVTDFDETLRKINVIPQDIGRVLLNLINNAFYTVNERSKQNIEGYKPEVIVKTSLIPPSADGGGGALISVSDNGSGIPSSIIDKIF
ncbi:MAG TPA: two-component regulator propeller domain-containing protein, partial [Draconibacterium sp.]|nr:two-component regulator propeller domain-containing protein [Draconibacterium sp.]